MDNVNDTLNSLKIERKPAVRLVTSNYGVCTKCRGAGYLRLNVPFGHPQFGKPQMCECKKAEIKAEQQQALLDLSGIVGLKRYARASFENFHDQVPGVREAKRLAITYADHPSGWLVLLGRWGCGKTHLAVAVGRSRVEAGDTVLIQAVPDLLDHLRSAFSPRAGQSYDERFEQMKSVDLLVLDDYGAQHDTDWATEKLFQLLNHRYNGSLPTVITSNNMALVGVDPRICSRLSDRELVTIVRMEEARDYRVYGDSEEE
jgi:DNA replication protein DnaC